MQYDETPPKNVRYVLNILQEMKTTETRRVSRVDVMTDPFTISQVWIWNLRSMMFDWAKIWDIMWIQPK